MQDKAVISPTIEVMTTRYRILSPDGKRCIYVTKTKDSQLFIETRGQQNEFRFKGSNPNTVAAIAELLLEASKL